MSDKPLFFCRGKAESEKDLIGNIGFVSCESNGRLMLFARFHRAPWFDQYLEVEGPEHLSLQQIERYWIPFRRQQDEFARGAK